MFDEDDSGLNSVSSFETAFNLATNGLSKRTSNGSVGITRMNKNTIFPPSSAFKVYNKVSQKHRYIPRQWTQAEFEAALPERFKDIRKTIIAQKDVAIDLTNGKLDVESGIKKNENQLSLSPENTSPSFSPTPSQYSAKKPVSRKKISDLTMPFESDQNEDCCGLFTGTNSVNELQNSKKSEAAVKLSTDHTPETETEDTSADCELGGSEGTNSYNAFISFWDACLMCFFNIDAIEKIVSQASSSCEPCLSSDGGKFKDLKIANLSGNTDQNLWQLSSQEAFPNYYEKISTQSNEGDEQLKSLLETLIEEFDDGHHNLRSVFQGKFCHARFCEHCETAVREYESFLFLNPSSPPAIASESRTVDVSYLSCADGVWRISSHEISVTPGMLVTDLKEDLIKHPEFPGPLNVSSIEIGEVKGSCLEQVLDATKDLWDIHLEPTSSLFAFHVMSFQSGVKSFGEPGRSCAQVAKSRSSGFVDMSYHLYFNCGLCLDDGKDVGLLMHRSCGGMVCRDCLDEISRSNPDWELCPCPICERPIDLNNELCATKIDAETDGDETQEDVPCAIMFRANGRRSGSTELFGYPVLLSLPQKTTGYHLYRCTGCLLPKELPVKYKTSFTLHNVDNSGLRCGACSSSNCTGCLIRIDDTIDIRPDSHLAVHFDDLAEDSKKDFGMMIRRKPDISKTQVLFDGILRSCVDASSCSEGLCPKCFHFTKTISSISKFPELLIIYLNRKYTAEGLPANMSVADVSRFLTIERGNSSRSEGVRGLTYQLTAAVFEQSNGTSPTYKPHVLQPGGQKWLFYDEVDMQVRERDPNFLYLTCDGVLFYEPVDDPPPTESSPPQATVDGVGDDKVGTSYLDCPLGANSRKLHRMNIIKEKKATKHSRRKTSECNNSDELPKQCALKPWENSYEPGECYLADKLVDQRSRESNAYGSRLSLGEIKRDGYPCSKGIAEKVLEAIDTISPICTTDIDKPESRLVRETKKLVKAVKTEDAYGIVCSLKKGAKPCLLVNDVSALHLAVGIKSDQRRSMVAYLLKYAGDVNVTTADGTTPMHVAAAWGHQDAVELLLAHGGDPFERTDIEGNSAFDIAVKDCSTYLQSVYNGERNSTRFLEFSTSSNQSPNNVSNSRIRKDGFKDHDGSQERRLEDIVRSNVGLPSFVEEGTSNFRLRRRWRRRLRNFRERSTGILRSLRKMGSIRRRSRIGVMVTEKSENN